MYTNIRFDMHTYHFQWNLKLGTLVYVWSKGVVQGAEILISQHSNTHVLLAVILTFLISI